MHTDIPLPEVLSTVTVEELERDPYPFYTRVREESPIAFVPGIGHWLATGFEAVKAIHQDSERFDTRAPDPVFECIGEHNILGLDGERHQRYRRGLHACLAPRTVESYADEIIVEVVERQLEKLSESSAADLVAEYFEPISVLALGRVIGVPEIDADTLRRWFHGIISGSSNIADDREVAEEANAISREIDDRMWEVFERIDGEPSDTIVSHLLRSAHGEDLAARVHDISPTLKIVIGGGLQEPGHGAGTLMYALLDDEQLFSRFAADPAELIRPAIEEAIRWVAPIQIDERRTSRDLELNGVEIPANTFILASLGAANRDPAVFGANAEVYDVDRPRTQHLGFGFGSHFCSGNYFGRVVMRVAVQRLVESFPKIHPEPGGQPSFRGFSFRAPEGLPVRLG